MPVGSSGGANLVFSEEFDGAALNTSRWHTCSWWATSTCSIETNNELELYTKNNVSVANGMLKLQARRENAVAWNGKTYNYTSGMVSTGGRSGEIAPGFTFKYGYMESRVKIPAGKGLWPAFWTLPADYSWPPEIDVMEIIGDKPNVQEMHYHYIDASGAQRSAGKNWAGPDFSQDWHTFGVDWQPGSLVWYVDGVERWRFTDAAVTSKPAYLLLNLAVGGNWPGSPDASTPFPSDYLVDYVRVWDRFGTPGSTPTTTPTTTPPTTTPPSTTPPPPPPSSGYAGGVAGDGPVSYWRLGDATGASAADSIGTNPGSYRNGVTTGRPSLLSSDSANPAALFDGVNDSVSVPSSSGLAPTGAVTVEAWVRPTALPTAGSFASVASKGESYALQFNGPQLEFTTIQGATRRRVQAAPGAVVAGQTYHVVGTYDGTTQRLYVNGAQVASAPFSGPLNANNASVVMGSWDTTSEFASATIDDVAVYAKALTAAQVTNHYNLGSAAAPPAQRALTVSRSGSGSGSVASSPGGISCGTTCSTSVASGTTVSLTASPVSGSTFAGWSGGGCTGTAGCTTTVTADTSVTATFQPAAPPAYGAVVAGDDPVSYWRLGESWGSSAWDSAAGNTGTYRNGVVLGAPSLLASDSANRAASFDGVNDSVAVPSSTGLSPTAAVTMEAWVRPTAKPAAGSFASVASKAESYSLQFNGPKLEFTTMQGTTRRRVQAPASAVVAGQTYHIVGTYDGFTQRLYVNGVQVASGGFSGPMNANTRPVVLGSWDTTSEFLRATIDDVAVYAKALTPAQIANHYSRGRA